MTAARAEKAVKSGDTHQTISGDTHNKSEDTHQTISEDTHQKIGDTHENYR